MPDAIAAPGIFQKVPYFTISISNPMNAGEYFAARRMASTMLTSLAIPVPAISMAVPWSTEVRRMGIPAVTAMVRSKSSVLVAMWP